MHKYDQLISLTVALAAAGNYSLKEGEKVKPDTNSGTYGQAESMCRKLQKLFTWQGRINPYILPVLDSLVNLLG